MLHEYFPDVGSRILSEGKKDFIDLLLSFEQLGSNSLGALSARTDLASEEIHVELKECIPILLGLVAIDSYSGTVCQDIDHLLLVFLKG